MPALELDGFYGRIHAFSGLTQSRFRVEAGITRLRVANDIRVLLVHTQEYWVKSRRRKIVNAFIAFFELCSRAHRQVRVPKSLMRRILQESNSCATFAAMTTFCFESEEQGCASINVRMGVLPSSSGRSKCVKDNLASFPATLAWSLDLE